jgi:hypothetical protein
VNKVFYHFSIIFSLLRRAIHDYISCFISLSLSGSLFIPLSMVQKLMHHAHNDNYLSKQQDPTPNGTTETPSAAQLKAQVDQLRKKLSNLVQICNSAAVECDKMSVIQEVRATFLAQCRDKLCKAQREFHTLYYESENDGGILPAISIALHDTLTMSHNSRFQLALQTFRMYRLDVGDDNTVAPNLQPKQPRGIGKIGGLPIPHSGPILYSCLPPEVLTSALRLVASLTHTLSRILGITLPHPILLHTPINNNSDTAVKCSRYWNHNCDIASIPPDDIQQREEPYSRSNRKEPITTSPSSGMPQLAQQDLQKSTLLNSSDYETEFNITSRTMPSFSPLGEEDSHPSWSVRRTITKAATGAISRAGKLLIPVSSTPPLHDHADNIKPSSKHTTPTSEETLMSSLIHMDPRAIQERIRYCTATFIQDCNSDGEGLKPTQYGKSQLSQATEYELNATTKNNCEEFSVGLQLLQNDIVALCVHSGVPVSTLWPAEAILLNLNALQSFCSSQLHDG